MARPPLVGMYDWTLDPGTTVSEDALANPRPQLGVAGPGGVTIVFNQAVTIGIIAVINAISDGGTISVAAGGYGETKSANAADANGPYPQWELAALGFPRYFIPPAPVVTDVVSVGFGGVDFVGYIACNQVWEAPIGMKYGWGLSVNDVSTINRVPFGSTYPTKAPKTRVLTVAWDFLLQSGVYGEGVEDQIFSGPLRAGVAAGKSMPIAIVPMPDDADNLERTSVWGAESDAPQFTNDFFATWSASISIEQWV